jgi:hypothetical protein
VLVSVERRLIEHFRRNDDGTWTLTVCEAGSLLRLPDLGGSIAVDEVYEGDDAEEAT